MRTRLSLWTAMLSAVMGVAFHAAHAAAMIAAAGATGLQAHAHHAHRVGTDGSAWLAWLGWGVNALSLALCAGLFVSYMRHRREDRRRAASHLTTCLITFAVVLATSIWALS